MRLVFRGPAWGLFGSLLFLLIAEGPAHAQGPWSPRATTYYRPTGSYQPASTLASTPPSSRGLASTPMLGTFYPTPYMTVGGNGVVGGSGFTPLQQYGDRAMSLYGPFSSLRAVSAPVTVYSRGYDGIVRPEVGNSFSYPFLPPASPVIYPTRANQRDRFDYQSTPPWWEPGYNWVDQN